MKKLGLTLVMAMMAVMLVAGGAWGLPFNVRPVYSDSDDTTLDSLQGIFDGIASTINVRTEQESAAIFTNQSQGANAAYVASLSWDADSFPFEFGIYEYQNIDNTVALFKDSSNGTGNSNPGDYTTLNFDAGAGIVYSEYHDSGVVGSTVISQTSDWIDNFGFYFSWSDGSGVHRYYSEDDLNDTKPAFLAYQANGDDVTIAGQENNDADHWYVAMEGYGGNIDFNDIVVQMESIQPAPVPEPGTMALLGIGLLGLAFVGQRKLKIKE
jgi:hypothetical protein